MLLPCINFLYFLIFLHLIHFLFICDSSVKIVVADIVVILVMLSVVLDGDAKHDEAVRDERGICREVTGCGLKMKNEDLRFCVMNDEDCEEWFEEHEDEVDEGSQDCRVGVLKGEYLVIFL